MSGLGRGLAWTLLSVLLLVMGFGGVVLGVLELGRLTGSIDPGVSSQILAASYFRVVFFKGLLPQLLLALAIWGALGRFVARRLEDAERVGARTLEAWVLAAAGAVAYAIVAPLLLTAELPGWPALQLRTVGHHLGTGSLMLVGVVAAAWLGRRLAYPVSRTG